MNELTTTEEPEVLTSDKLIALQTELKTKKAALRAIDDMDSNEYETALGEIFKTNAAIKAENAELLAAKRKAEIAEANNKRIALFDEAVAAYVANEATKADKKADQTAKDAAAADYAAKRESVVNILVGSTQKSSSTSKADGGKAGENAAAIVALHLDGKTNSEIEDAGYAKSTIWHAINNYKKSLA